MKKIMVNIMLPCFVSFLVSIFLISFIMESNGTDINFTQYISYFILYLLIPYINKLLLSLSKEEYIKLLLIGFVFLILTGYWSFFSYTNILIPPFWAEIPMAKGY